MDGQNRSATARVFHTPELLEHILIFVILELLPITDREDPRSVRTHGNAAILLHLLRCSRVNSSWYECILGSKKLQRSLFRHPDTQTSRAWDISNTSTRARQLHSYYTAPCLRAPQLNPVIQSTFSTYHFRFWLLSYDDTGNKHVAYLIITRRDIPAVDLRSRTGQGRSISDMLLAQPPPTALEATIWEERDETKDYVGRTTTLSEPSIVCETGVTIGLVHERVAKMFDKHRDVAAIKLTTV